MDTDSTFIFFLLFFIFLGAFVLCMSMIPEFIVFVRQVKCLFFVDMARRWLFSLFLSLCMLGSIYLCSSLLIMHAYRIDLLSLTIFLPFPLLFYGYIYPYLALFSYFLCI